ncbi:MAG: hypothetical protein LBF40_01495 [Deltaproteobacteria bacterium]|jgi:hypothetical protein|nr:hypothetical protein [Deltaproteobacteria bacterium]
MDELERQNACEKAFWVKTLELSEECLDLDRRFLAELNGLGRKDKGGKDPLDPTLWENFIEARKSLVEYTTGNLNLLAQDKSSQGRNKDMLARLETTLGEVMRLEERLAGFLSENLVALKDTIDGIAKNQAIFSAYGRNNTKPMPEALETRA